MYNFFSSWFLLVCGFLIAGYLNPVQRLGYFENESPVRKPCGCGSGEVSTL